MYTTLRRKLKKHSRSISRVFINAKKPLGLLAIVGVISLILLNMQHSQKIYTSGLLDTIAKVESRNNYNAHYGNANNTKIQFTSMTVGDVLAWQEEFVSKGNPSSAVGRYQFIDSTLRGLVQELKIDEEETFTPALQDTLAVALLERRGVREYAAGNMSKEEFAHNLSKEWAALPKVIGENPEQSYYAGDGMNRALLSVGEIYSGIATVRKL